MQTKVEINFVDVIHHRHITLRHNTEPSDYAFESRDDFQSGKLTVLRNVEKTGMKCQTDEYVFELHEIPLVTE